MSTCILILFLSNSIFAGTSGGSLCFRWASAHHSSGHDCLLYHEQVCMCTTGRPDFLSALLQLPASTILIYTNIPKSA